jgi:hypothetical protein
MNVPVQALRQTDWVRAATMAQMILSQSLTDEVLDYLATTELREQVAVERRAA